MSTLQNWYELYMIIMGAAGHMLFLFQALKIFYTQRAHDVSLIGFVIAFISLVSWLLYGIMKKDRALIIVNAIGATAAFVCICAIIIYR